MTFHGDGRTLVKEKSRKGPFLKFREQQQRSKMSASIMYVCIYVMYTYTREYMRTLSYS